MSFEVVNYDGVFGTVFALKADAFKPKFDAKTKAEKTIDGRVIYQTPLQELTIDGVTHEAIGSKSGVSLGLLTPTDLVPAVKYKLDGRIWITPWVNGNSRFVSLSIIAERVVPVGVKPVKSGE